MAAQRALDRGIERNAAINSDRIDILRQRGSNFQIQISALDRSIRAADQRAQGADTVTEFRRESETGKDLRQRVREATNARIQNDAEIARLRFEQESPRRVPEPSTSVRQNNAPVTGRDQRDLFGSGEDDQFMREIIGVPQEFREDVTRNLIRERRPVRRIIVEDEDV